MNLYTIDRDIEGCIDDETGEVLDDERLASLYIAREEKIENVALWVKNLKAESEACKREKEAFAQRENRANNLMDRLKNWLSIATQETKFKTDRVVISFRKSQSVEWEDEASLIHWAQSNGRDDLLTYKEPTLSKSAVKDGLRNGLEIPGAVLVEHNNIQIR